MGPGARYLAESESLVLNVRRHWSLLLRPGSQALGLLILLSLLGLVTSPGDGSTPLDTLAGLVAVVIVARFLWKAWEWWAERIVVTNHRIFEISGLLTRKVASMPLTKVTDMTYRRSVGGRLLGYGELVVESAGQDQALGHIYHLPRPDDFYRTVTSLVTAAEGALPGPTKAPGPWTASDDVDTGPLPRVIL
ncbi:MAG: PH domain-containing protein [Actinobacteria bacterium]|nr:PH domain-containing protein [Actinomycetota bacterium]